MESWSRSRVRALTWQDASGERIISSMRLPFDRKRMRERNQLDRADAWTEARRRSPAERLQAELELCELMRDLGAGPIRSSIHRDLAQKSRLWIAPLRASAKKKRRR
jgi:hypothetical protein